MWLVPAKIYPGSYHPPEIMLSRAKGGDRALSLIIFWALLENT